MDAVFQGLRPFAEADLGQGVLHHPVGDGVIEERDVLFDGAFTLLHSPDIAIGFFLPFVHAEARSTFDLFNKSTKPEDVIDSRVAQLLPGEINQVERVRLDVHREIGLSFDDWDATGFGDLDVYLRWRGIWDHVLLLKSLNANLIGGVLFPTSISKARDNFNSVPFMGNGHWGLYVDVVTEAELKTDIKLGLMLGLAGQLPRKKERRIAVFREPSPFSALIAKTTVRPGVTFKTSPYLLLENITDGFHINARYTYLRHTSDTWRDRRKEIDVDSYLTRQGNDEAEVKEIKENRKEKKRLTSWRAHFISLRLSYDSKAALKKWFLRPTFFFQLDSPFSGKGVTKTHQFTCGVELHF